MANGIENIERLETLESCQGTDYRERSDWELVQFMCDGDGDAFVEIVSRYETKLIAYARRYVGSVDIAKDICQEVFLKLINRPPSMLQNDHLGPWLFRVSHNLAIDIIRRRKFELTGESLPDVSAEHHSPFLSLTRKNDTDILRSLIGRLSEDFRQVVELRIYAEMAFKDIAETLQIPQGTALWRMHEAINQLRAMWRQYESRM